MNAKTVFLVVVGFILAQIYKANKSGREFRVGDLNVFSAISNPQVNPVSSIRGEYAPETDIGIEQYLSSVMANPGLVANVTPQGQFAIDPRAVSASSGMVM